MGLLKKKDRPSPPRPDGGSLAGLPRSMPGERSPSEGDKAKDAERPGSEARQAENAYANELRLAVEAVAAGDSPSRPGTSDKYGLLAELERQRRRVDGAAGGAATTEPSRPAERAAEERSPRPQPAEPHAADAVSAVEPDGAGRSRDAAPAAAEPSGEAPSTVVEARARLEAFERSIFEKTEAMRQRAAELARREQELAAKVRGLDALEAEAGERLAALEERERELQAKLGDLQHEAERLEQEQAIWGEATRESKTRLAELEQQLAARQADLEGAEATLDARRSELDRREEVLAAREAELAAREAELRSGRERLAAEREELAASQEELARRRAELEAAAASHAEREQALERREATLRASEQALAERERDLDRRASGLAERERTLEEGERDLGPREARLDARERALAEEREALARERAEWEEQMSGVFSRLSELESDLVSSLSVAGMIKRELEGREAAPAKERRGGRPPSEQEEARAFYRGDGAEQRAGSDAEGHREAVVEATGLDAQANASDWWARQLGRRKKD